MRRIAWVVLILVCATGKAQDLRKAEAAIMAEGKALYHSEWASWYGTDIFMEKCADKRDKIAGYLSYDNGTGLINIFYSKDAEPQVLSTINFGYNFDETQYTLDTIKRVFNTQEKELYTIRKVAINRMETDTTFKWYNNVSLNPVPFIYKNKKRVYVLSGPKVNGVVVFGNDYQIDFDKKSSITAVTKLHNTIIPAYYNSSETDSAKIQVAAMHNHLKGKDEFITVTDVCTLMLYGKFTTWNSHIVISEKYVSLWDVKK